MSQPVAFKNLIVRTAVVIARRYGYIYACDPRREKKGEPHTYVFAWDDGQVERGEGNYDAHSVCLIEDPDRGSVDIAEAGYYTADTDDDRVTQDLFANSAPTPASKRARGLRAVRDIAGRAYAIGLRGMVYRLDAIERWTRIDEGLPQSFDGQAIHGFGHEDVYAVGRAGQIWRFDGRRWRAERAPTKANLNAVVGAPDGTVYAGGHGGVLLRRRRGTWSQIEHEGMNHNIWDLEWFAGTLYVSTLDGVFFLDGDHLRPVAYGKHTPRSTYQLSSNGGVMWSSGETDIMELDGKAWTRIL